jgi:hypothetical protein
VVDHGLVTRSTMDRRWRGQDGEGAWWCVCWSRASDHSREQKLTDGGGEWRMEHKDPIAGLTGARAVV